MADAVRQLRDAGGVLLTIGFFVFGPQMLIGMAAAECSHKEAAGAATGFVGLFAYRRVPLRLAAGAGDRHLALERFLCRDRHRGGDIGPAAAAVLHAQAPREASVM